MGDHANDACDDAFFETFGGHEWGSREDYDFDDGCSRILVKKRLGDECRDCTGHMVSRFNSSTMQKFLGCSRYPKCKYTY
jgi:hypothetical protein